ncbi:MAG: hypothetical protein AMXMBFR64_45050 [Myxococcales bacterium]
MRALRLKSTLILALLAATPLSTSCGDSADPGTLIVDWSIATSCSAAGIEDVVVRLMFSTTLEEYDSLRVSCEQMTATFAPVAAGVYDVRVAGVNDKGVELYVGDLAGVSVSNGSTTKVPQPILLSQKKGAIDLGWEFETGLCSTNKVTKVQLAIFDAGLNQLYEAELKAPLDCDPFGLPAAQRTIGKNPDPSYVPNGVLIGDLNAQDFVVQLFGLDASGTKTHKAKATIPVARGEITTKIMELVGCGSSKVPDLQCK